MQKMIDVLLIQPPVAFNKEVLKNDIVPNCPHLGLLYLATSVEKVGLRSYVLDNMDISLSIDQILDFIQVNNVRLVGVTAMTMNLQGAVQIAQAVKSKFGNRCVTCLGGPHLSADLTFIDRYPCFDFGIRGEADKAFAQATLGIIKQDVVPKGLIEPEPILNLDDLPIPSRSGIDYTAYRAKGLWANHLMATRGCPFGCIFCSIPAMLRKFRKRSPHLVVQEICELLSLNGMRHFIFSDDVFTLDRAYVLDLCKELSASNMNITWEVQTRTSLVDDELLRSMYKCGCRKILFGVETGSERIRNQIVKKKITVEQIQDATELCWKNGIEPDWYMMLGFPTETRKEIEETIQLPITTRPNPNLIGVHITMPLPGSTIFDDMISAGELDKHIIDDFAKGKLGDGYKDVWPYYVPAGLTLEDLKQARAEAYRRFYFRFGYILRRLIKDLFSWRKMKVNMQQALALFFYGRAVDDK